VYQFRSGRNEGNDLYEENESSVINEKNFLSSKSSFFSIRIKLHSVLYKSTDPSFNRDRSVPKAQGPEIRPNYKFLLITDLRAAV
jgi:hypothetical protein